MINLSCFQFEIEGGRSPKKPSATEIALIRSATGLTQREAAALVYTTMRSWRAWEAGERKMHPAIWELFRIKVACLLV